MMLSMAASAFTPAPRLAPAGSRMAAGDRASLLRMAAASGVTQVDGVRIGPPPDLPSLLLANRIVYIGMPLVPSVTVRRLAAPRQRTLSLLPYLRHADTLVRSSPWHAAHHTPTHASQELLVAELLYLNFESNSKGIYMYVNSVGNLGGGLETEAFAVLDTMNYIQPEVTLPLPHHPNPGPNHELHPAGSGDEAPAPKP